MTKKRFLTTDVADLRCDSCGDPVYTAEECADAALVDRVVGLKNDGNTGNLCRKCGAEIMKVIRQSPKVWIPLPPDPPKRRRKKS
jgi:hypothetical protein